MSATVTVTGACFQALNGQALTRDTCTTLPTTATDPGEESPFGSVTCTYADGTCRCNLLFRAETVQGSGSYTEDGTSFVNERGQSVGYCVEGDTLRVLSPGTDGQPAGTLVLARQ
jgi:hypothetical protein